MSKNGMIRRKSENVLPSRRSFKEGLYAGLGQRWIKMQRLGERTEG